MKQILICGIGAIGSNLTSLLARDLKEDWTITVLDKDCVEERNIRAGTQFYTKDQISYTKVEALQYNIYQAYGREIEIYHGDIRKWLVEGGKSDIVIDCFDNKEAREVIQAQYKDFSSVLHVGFSDDFTFAIEWAKDYIVPDTTVTIDICEMRGAASFVTMVSAISSQVVLEKITNNKEVEVVGNRFSSKIIV